MSRNLDNLPKGTYQSIICQNLFDKLMLNELEELSHNFSIKIDRNIEDQKIYKLKLCCALAKELLTMKNKS